MIKTVLKDAQEYCQANGQRYTAPRAEVLKIMLSNKKPLGAYQVLEQLGKTMDNPKPPTAYRAIEFWQEHGFIHRIESMNAYIACKAGHRHKGSQFMICNDCGDVAEAHLCHLPKSLSESASQNAFTPSRWNIEIYGQCAKCS